MSQIQIYEDDQSTYYENKDRMFDILIYQIPKAKKIVLLTPSVLEMKILIKTSPNQILELILYIYLNKN
jgi:hypothetical protein